MFTFMKFIMTFTFSFLILSIPIKNDHLFTHIHEATRPFTAEFMNIVRRNTQQAVQETSEIGRRAFTNTRPVQEAVNDKVNETRSSFKKQEIFHDDYTDEERDLLMRVLKSAH